MPAFTLNDPAGNSFNNSELMGDKGLLVIFTCNHCPYAIAIWPRTIALANHAKTLGINTVAINPNIHPNYPEDSPEKMQEKITEWGISFPYLVDASQQIAKDYQAQCTPDIYLFNQQEQLVYHGRVDDNWQEESKVTKQELKEAIDNLANDQPISKNQYHSIGCSIKWN
ncbi:thioredoxin family protein [bacterium K02(2017)]|nr:thioredoxin family protein [bacterium K02(2017)]